MKKTAIVSVCFRKQKIERDIEVPLFVAADRVIDALFEAYDMNNQEKRYLLCQEPYALIKGKQTLQELGVRDGSTLIYID